MFELAIFSAFCLIAAVALVTIYQRRQDVLYGPYIEDVSWPPARPDDSIGASS
ncbi:MULTISPECIES: hypothetical protein [Bradyrhizobium]|uniref:Uncharacterized protein n=1 Tax=Bradyrhizobium aeschynomenes TaxID=2734909 RepID=A0ABX2C6J7_9BRAD|nr:MULTISPECIES: hypothetical protein [Bradyrhizobium]NPU12871.1 hypothetical protein [Bradyrhizobium aeschynomenes]NPU63904.1 hypothetical protein [Bradyrhizobium aeschynomenes]NPV23194.1 hypothetical protein [Bradyrhizobium aeschynomenes]